MQYRILTSQHHHFMRLRHIMNMHCTFNDLDRLKNQILSVLHCHKGLLQIRMCPLQKLKEQNYSFHKEINDHHCYSATLNTAKDKHSLYISQLMLALANKKPTINNENHWWIYCLYLKNNRLCILKVVYKSLSTA